MESVTLKPYGAKKKEYEVIQRATHVPCDEFEAGLMALAGGQRDADGGCCGEDANGWR